MGVTIRRRNKVARVKGIVGRIARYGEGSGKSWIHGWQPTQRALIAKKRTQQRARRRAFNAARKAAA